MENSYYKINGEMRKSAKSKSHLIINSKLYQIGKCENECGDLDISQEWDFFEDDWQSFAEGIACEIPGITSNESKLFIDKGAVKDWDKLKFGIWENDIKLCKEEKEYPAYLAPCVLTKDGSVPIRSKNKLLTSQMARKFTLADHVKNEQRQIKMVKFRNQWRWVTEKFTLSRLNELDSSRVLKEIIKR